MSDIEKMYDVIEIEEVTGHEVNKLLRTGNYILIGVGKIQDISCSSPVYNQTPQSADMFIYSLGKIK